MDTDTKHSLYHSAPYSAAGTAMMTFKPINAIHQHLCAFHVYSHDRTRHLEAHHYCTHLSPDFHQCIIYDSDSPSAKLIGIEYIVSETLFDGLPAAEKPLWHSHKYEVESGLLQMHARAPLNGAVTDLAEQPAILEIQRTSWSRTPPTARARPPEMVKARDERSGMDTARKRELRKGYLPPYEKREEADAWEETKKGIVFEAKEVDYKPYPGEQK
ncbi:hypothetical protein EVJ58_g9181 [Rhodofomes roseus]|uniref:DUF1264-domain-containing protein n=1 Tax=Rhodofomes roseus TaxID=34475 RepID=A0A4Y9XUR8_9APHY|nr:hypothetical protein EVJ58_g9181 [Rhodofomes roseus]